MLSNPVFIGVSTNPFGVAAIEKAQDPLIWVMRFLRVIDVKKTLRNMGCKDEQATAYARRRTPRQML